MFGSDHSGEYNTDEEKAAYFKGRIGGDLATPGTSASEIEGGLGGGAASALETGGVGALVGGLVALHGSFAGGIAMADITTMVSKLYRLQANSQSINDESSSSNKKFENSQESNKKEVTNEIPKGFKETKEFGTSHGQKIFKKGNRYYSRDVGQKTGGSHKGGAWKVFKKVSGRLKRIGTADKDLKIFTD